MTNAKADTVPVRDWSAIGIDWESLDVKRRMGDHASDDVVIGQVQKPVVIASKLDAVIEHFGATRVGGWLTHSSSLEVRSRAWFKQRAAKDSVGMRRMGVEAMREAVYQNVLLAAGGRGRTVQTVTRIVIGPFTRVVNAGDTVEYATLFGEATAALIDAWPQADVAMIRMFVASSLETAGFTPDADDAEEVEAEA